VNSVAERSQAWKNQSQIKLEIKREEKKFNETAGCTFKPDISSTKLGKYLRPATYNKKAEQLHRMR
jgi:hypothetical protein